MNFRFLFLRTALLVLGASLYAGAATVPGRYIIELDAEPVALVQRSPGHTGTALQAHRDTVRAQQRSVAARLTARSARVTESLDTVLNALIVEIPDEQAALLTQVPGVRRVHQVRTVKMLLDRAVMLHKVTDAWAQIGGSDKAGVGIKVAIIDSGIESAHPAFQDSSLAMPAGFPKVNVEADLAYTNSKVIVARSYVSLLSGRRDPDQSARDHVGHGTSLGMAVAGVRTAGPNGTIMGLAPRAHLGNYKVFGTPGYNDEATDDAILKAIDDAVKDGMDIINLSLGAAADASPRLDDDPDVAAVENAIAAGVIVIAAAGNDGPEPTTVSSPATAPNVIAAGAMQNDRTFCVCAEVTGRDMLYADFGQFTPASNSRTAPTVSGPLADVSGTGDGFACDPLPEGSLSGRIALIQRGGCNYSKQLDNAQNAGAAGALLYEDADNDFDVFFRADQGSNTLPTALITHYDGLALRQSAQTNPSLRATLHFRYEQARLNPGVIASFSSRGPNVDAGIKPELLAVGEGFYSATQTLDSNGDMYDASGFLAVDGTSFSSPTVAGAAAVLKAARPGLKVAQYRSLLINTAAPAKASVTEAASAQQAGAGILDLSAALRANVTAEPAMLSLGSGSGDVQLTRDLIVTNAGTSPDTFLLTVTTATGSMAPTLSKVFLTLKPNESATVPVSIEGSGLAAGAYEGVIRITGAGSGQEIRVPYWYGVASNTPTSIAVLYSAYFDDAGSRIPDAITFRVLDAAGLPITSVTPEVSVLSGGGRITRLNSYDAYYPGVYGISLRLGAAAGMNSFQIRAGEVTRVVQLLGY